MKVSPEKENDQRARPQAKAGKAFFGVQDMTSGDPFRGIVRFSVPLLIGNFAQQLRKAWSPTLTTAAGKTMLSIAEQL